MRRAYLLLVALAACGPHACEGPESLPEENSMFLDVTHDKARGVTCYVYHGYGVSCLPDSQLRDGGVP